MGPRASALPFGPTSFRARGRGDVGGRDTAPSPHHNLHVLRLFGASMIGHRSRGDPRMPDLLETSENGVTTLTLNRPERLNTLSPAMTLGLKETLERLATDHGCGVIVIAGAGRGWCAGGDVKTMESRGKDQT